MVPMDLTVTRSRALAAVTSGLATAGYYAVPDLVRSRTARGWAKTALLAVSTAALVPDFREIRAARHADRAASDGAAERETVDLSSVPASRRVALVGAGVAVLGGTAAGIVAVERWIFRRGEARAAAGVRLPHTRTALVLGALSAALAFLPPPDVTSPADATAPGRDGDSPAS